MKLFQLLVIGAITILFAPAAGAGAATGMPSPFFPPYRDFGLCVRCVSKLNASPRYSAFTRYHPQPHPYLRADAADKVRKSGRRNAPAIENRSTRSSGHDLPGQMHVSHSEWKTVCRLIGS
jgi:hypothetical protein